MALEDPEGNAEGEGGSEELQVEEMRRDEKRWLNDGSVGNIYCIRLSVTWLSHQQPNH